MGRIADALKRAEHERSQAVAFSPEQDFAVTEAPEPSTLLHTTERTPACSAVEGDDQRLNVNEGLSESLVPFHEPSSLVTEQYRSLRTRLLSQNPQYEHRVIAVTSAVPKEGKSVTTLNLGCILI